MMAIGFFRRLVPTLVRDERELRSYVARITGIAIAIAIGIDAINQAIFFTDWATFVRSLAVAAVIAVVIAVPIISKIGRAHLSLYRAKLEVEHLSRIDPLTGLSNRRAFMEAALATDLADAAMVIADIDRFKSVNDTFGHLSGDTVIEAVGARLRSELGDLGVVGRLGGEEFALLAVGVPREELRERMRRLLRGIAALEVRSREGAPISVTLSLGIAFGEPGRSVEQVYADADRALYIAKASGRDRLCVLDDANRIASLEGEHDDVTWVEVPVARPGRSWAAA